MAESGSVTSPSGSSLYTSFQQTSEPASAAETPTLPSAVTDTASLSAAQGNMPTYSAADADGIQSRLAAQGAAAQNNSAAAGDVRASVQHEKCAPYQNSRSAAGPDGAYFPDSNDLAAAPGITHDGPIGEYHNDINERNKQSAMAQDSSLSGADRANAQTAADAANQKANDALLNLSPADLQHAADEDRNLGLTAQNSPAIFIADHVNAVLHPLRNAAPKEPGG